MKSHLLDSFFQTLEHQQLSQNVQIPPRAEAHRVADALFLFLFPMLSEEPKPARVQYALLRHDMMRLLYPLIQDGGESVGTIADGFFHQLPEVYEMLLEDAKAFYDFDPAATCTEEVIATYPGFYAIANYRISNLLHRLGAPLLPVFLQNMYMERRALISIRRLPLVGPFLLITGQEWSSGPLQSSETM